MPLILRESRAFGNGVLSLRVPNTRGLHGERRDRLLTTRGVRVGRTDDDPATPIAAVGLDECGGEGTVRPQA